MPPVLPPVLPSVLLLGGRVFWAELALQQTLRLDLRLALVLLRLALLRLAQALSLAPALAARVLM